MAELQAAFEEEAALLLSRLQEPSLANLESAELGLREGLLRVGDRFYEKALVHNPG